MGRFSSSVFLSVRLFVLLRADQQGLGACQPARKSPFSTGLSPLGPPPACFQENNKNIIFKTNKCMGAADHLMPSGDSLSYHLLSFYSLCKCVSFFPSGILSLILIFFLQLFFIVRCTLTIYFFLVAMLCAGVKLSVRKAFIF